MWDWWLSWLGAQAATHLRWIGRSGTGRFPADHLADLRCVRRALYSGQTGVSQQDEVTGKGQSARWGDWRGTVRRMRRLVRDSQQDEVTGRGSVSRMRWLVRVCQQVEETGGGCWERTVCYMLTMLLGGGLNPGDHWKELLEGNMYGNWIELWRTSLRKLKRTLEGNKMKSCRYQLYMLRDVAVEAGRPAATVTIVWIKISPLLSPPLLLNRYGQNLSCVFSCFCVMHHDLNWRWFSSQASFSFCFLTPLWCRW